jgi:hypothetical protein
MDLVNRKQVNRKPVNHSIFLTRLRWDTVNGSFQKMEKFSTDCIVYKFKKPLEIKEQADFLDFLGDTDNLNELSSVDFCNYFLTNNIPFSIKFRFLPKLGIKNLQYVREIRILQKELAKLK